MCSRKGNNWSQTKVTCPAGRQSHIAATRRERAPENRNFPHDLFPYRVVGGNSKQRNDHSWFNGYKKMLLKKQDLDVRVIGIESASWSLDTFLITNESLFVLWNTPNLILNFFHPTCKLSYKNVLIWTTGLKYNTRYSRWKSVNEPLMSKLEGGTLNAYSD